jgi:hypothetical protein
MTYNKQKIQINFHNIKEADGSIKSVVYNCCRPSPAQSLSGPNPAGFIATFYCFGFEIPPTWRARSPYLYHPGTGWPIYAPRHSIDFIFVASYNSQGYGGGIRPHLRTGYLLSLCQSRIYFTSGGLRSISSSWRQAH